MCEKLHTKAQRVLFYIASDQTAANRDETWLPTRLVTFVSILAVVELRSSLPANWNKLPVKSLFVQQLNIAKSAAPARANNKLFLHVLQQK